MIFVTLGSLALAAFCVWEMRRYAAAAIAASGSPNTLVQVPSESETDSRPTPIGLVP